MVWYMYGMIWCGMVWYGMKVWYGMVWCQRYGAWQVVARVVYKDLDDAAGIVFRRPFYSLCKQVAMRCNVRP